MQIFGNEFIGNINATKQYARFINIIKPFMGLLNKEDTWLAGGSIRRIVQQDNDLGDFDLFFRNEEALERAKNFFEKDISTKFIKLYENEYNVSYQYTYIDGNNPIPIKIQLVFIEYFDNPEQVLEWFDYSICQCLFYPYEFIFGDYTLFDVAKKRLRAINIHHGVSSVRRMVKYASQGFTFCDGTIAEVLKQITDNPEMIRENVKYID